MNTTDFTFLFTKELKKLSDELAQYATNDDVWKKAPGISNSAGHLCQHLIGNLKTFIGAGLGGFAYTRERDKEFNARQFNKEQLLQLLTETSDIVKQTFEKMDAATLAAPYPKDYLTIAENQTTELVLTYLLAHASYHIGQVNYHRRLLQ